MANEEVLWRLKHASKEKIERLELSGLLSNGIIPSEIGQLVSLKRLYALDNGLHSLPAQIGQLANLQFLDLSFNKISQLPSEIGELNNLQILFLSDNEISKLPSDIGKLSNLEKLSLRNNKLTGLPDELGRLKKLKTLYLNDNFISSLSSQIGQLASLQTLDLSNNKLSALPAELGLLQNLQTLELSGNPTLTDPPPEIIRKGTTAILDYLRQQIEQGIDYLYEAKLLIVGEGEVGKTTLAKKIENNNYSLDIHEPSTEGINVIRWNFKLSTDTTFRLNIWDFGGQEIYHSTHQFFLTRRSLYVLVLDNRKENTDLDYWLSIVELLSDGSPIIIIQNEKQDRKCQINERALRGKFLSIKEILRVNLAKQHGFSVILNSIKHYASQLNHVGSSLPKKWIDVRRRLEEDERNYISLSEYFQTCQAHGFREREDQFQLSGYFHDLGVFLHFQNDPLLKKTIILKPEWGTAAVYKVLDTEEIIENLGHFNRSQLENIWKDSQYADMHDELLQLMVLFKLCYEIPTKKDNYIAPNLLSVEQCDYNWDNEQNLILHYEYDFMPKGILTRFIVERHTYIEEQRLVWKGGVVLSKDGARAEVIEYYSDRRIEVRVSGPRKKELLILIIDDFETIHSSYSDLAYRMLVPCTCKICRENQVPYLYPLSELKRFLDNSQPMILCHKSFEMVDIQKLIDEVMMNQSEIEVAELPLRDQVFISYSHKDREWLEELQKYLKPAVRKKEVKIWDDTKIEAGAEWRKEIQKALDSAKVAVLLVSADFLNSDFIDGNELPPLLEAAQSEGLVVIWILINHCLYEDSEIEKYQAAHSLDKPLVSLNDAEKAATLKKICFVIKEAANKEM